MKNIPRLNDGTIERVNSVVLTVWADDIFMGAGILMGVAKVTGNKQYRDEAIKQILLIDKRLVDPVTRVYWHGWLLGNSKNPFFKQMGQGQRLDDDGQNRCFTGAQ